MGGGGGGIAPGNISTSNHCLCVSSKTWQRMRSGECRPASGLENDGNAIRVCPEAVLCQHNGQNYCTAVVSSPQDNTTHCGGAPNRQVLPVSPTNAFFSTSVLCSTPFARLEIPLCESQLTTRRCYCMGRDNDS